MIDVCCDWQEEKTEVLGEKRAQHHLMQHISHINCC